MSGDQQVDIQIHGDYTELDAELDRLDLIPGPDATEKLGKVIGFAYITTQGEVHVETASLKLSAKIKEELGDKILTYELTYGGPSGGVHNPVNYAIYEKARGGAHDFMRSTSTLGPMWVEGMIGVLSKND